MAMSLIRICFFLAWTLPDTASSIDPELLEWMKSEAGSAAMENPQDDENGRKAVALMEQVNKMSSEDMFKLATESYGLKLTGQTVIELGPGAGYGTKVLVSKAPSAVFAYEVSPVFRKLMSEDASLSIAVSAGVLRIIGDDAISMRDVASSSVDVIFGMNVVYFLDPLGAYLSEMLRVLKPGGWIIFGVKPGAVKDGGASFKNKDLEAITAQMTAAGFASAALAPPRLKSDPPTPAMYTPLVCQKPNSPAEEL